MKDYYVNPNPIKPFLVRYKGKEKMDKAYKKYKDDKKKLAREFYNLFYN